MSRKKRQVVVEKKDVSLFTPKPVEILAKINVATPTKEVIKLTNLIEDTSAITSETNEPLNSNVTTERKPKVVNIDYGINGNTQKKRPLTIVDNKGSKQGEFVVFEVKFLGVKIYC